MHMAAIAIHELSLTVLARRRGGSMVSGCDNKDSIIFVGGGELETKG